MGWFFGSKKPKVPLPMGRPFDEKALRFPSAPVADRVIEPEQVKLAAGLQMPPLPMSGTVRAPAMPPQPVAPAPAPAYQPSGPLFIKVNVYQRILGELENLKAELAQLDHHNRALESSEYNEEHNFERLKSAVKVMHDRLLDVDKKIFKVQGG